MNNKNSVKDFTVNGKCSGCGECCTAFLSLSSIEIQRIKAYIVEHDIKQIRHILNGNQHVTCPFRDNENRKCNVYPVRPMICQKFLCNQDGKTIMQNQMLINKSAVYNVMPKPFASSHLIFYEDFEWDILFFTGMANGNQDDAKKLAFTFRSPIVEEVK